MCRVGAVHAPADDALPLLLELCELRLVHGELRAQLHALRLLLRDELEEVRVPGLRHFASVHHFCCSDRRPQRTSRQTSDAPRPCNAYDRASRTYFSVSVSGPWSASSSFTTLTLVSWFPRLRRFLLTLEIALTSSAHTPIECVRRDVLPFAAARPSKGATWSLGKYEIEDCRLFGGLNARAEGGGVERPRPTSVCACVRGDDADVGELAMEDVFPSINCSGRGAAAGGEHPDAGAGTGAVTALIPAMRESYASCDGCCGCNDRLNMRGCRCAGLHGCVGDMVVCRWCIERSERAVPCCQERCGDGERVRGGDKEDEVAVVESAAEIICTLLITVANIPKTPTHSQSTLTSHYTLIRQPGKRARYAARPCTFGMHTL